jgi:hypothetical protein
MQLSREEAVRMIQAYFRMHGLESTGLNDNNLGGASIGDYQIYFEYEPARRELKCSALIYKFHADPEPGVLQAFSDAAPALTNNGGGTLDYEPANKGLYLSRTYSEVVSDEVFAHDLAGLMQSSEIYGDRILNEVASTISVPKEHPPGH